ncbi:hypothetical protein EDC01DRAFT_675660 [Geopyxis carbonaria]|nr:hypothetical protein EDC01DRAFT_675660 [Geopyxis carbonaria]
MPRPELTYPKTATNKVNRMPNRGKYDTTTIHTLVNTCPVVHVSFIVPGAQPDDAPTPMVLPMLAQMGSFDRPSASVSDALDCYLHGYISSRLLRAGAQPLPVAICATHLDGLVLTLTPNSHSANYRSAILHGTAEAVTETDEKLWAMRLITDGIVGSDRWEQTRVPPDGAEMQSTGLLRVRVTSASAKIRAGGPGDEKKDTQRKDVTERCWTGVVPCWIQYGEPVKGGAGEVLECPAETREELKQRSEEARKSAEETARKGYP